MVFEPGCRWFYRPIGSISLDKVTLIGSVGNLASFDTHSMQHIYYPYVTSSFSAIFILSSFYDCYGSLAVEDIRRILKSDLQVV